MPRDAMGDAYISELIQLIKEVGQELIDRADQIVPPNSKAISGLDIRIEFPQGDRDILPEISWEVRTFSLNTVNRWNCESDTNEPNCNDCLYFDYKSENEPCVSCYRDNRFVRKE